MVVYYPSISTQLDLWTGEIDRVPWAGRSPRELTRGRKFLFSRREPQKSVSDFVDTAQLELWPPTEKALRFVYRGAPLLQEVKDESGSETSARRPS